MLGLDTNVLVRFLVQDDQPQFERAQKLIGRESRTGGGVLISLLVLLETEWVLRSRYSLTKAVISLGHGLGLQEQRVALLRYDSTEGRAFARARSNSRSRTFCAMAAARSNSF